MTKAAALTLAIFLAESSDESSDKMRVGQAARVGEEADVRSATWSEDVNEHRSRQGREMTEGGGVLACVGGEAASEAAHA